MSAQPVVAPVAVSSLLDLLQAPDVQRIYLHDYGAVDVPTLKRLEGTKSHCYPERAVVMAQRGDIVVTYDPVDPNYLHYLDRIGIGPGADGIVELNGVDRNDGRSRSLFTQLSTDDSALARIAERVEPGRAVTLSPYFASPSLEDLHRALAGRLQARVVAEGDASAAAIANRKDVVRDAARSLGVSTPDGEVCRLNGTEAQSIGDLLKAIRRNLHGTGSVMVRGAWSMHGVDNLVVDDGPNTTETVRRWAAERAHIRAYLVESRIPLVSSPNVQLYVCSDGSVVHLATTNQRLDEGASYVGSQYPHVTSLDRDLVSSAVTLAEWLSSLGYRGFLGLDFIETVDRRTGQPTCLLAEVNGRINGATYGLALAERLNQLRTRSQRTPCPAWMTNTELSVRARSFTELVDVIGDLMYSGPSSGCGVVPYTIGLLQYGSVHAAVLATTLDEARAIEREIVSRVAAA